MSDSRPKPWSNNPNAPKITYQMYLEEKAYFAGTLIGSMLYGMLIVLFFKCMTSLLSPAHRRGERIKWGLVSYTVIMFSLATVLTGMDLNIQSISHIDNRNFPGVKGKFPPGPYGYLMSIYYQPINYVPTVVFILTNWLADGLLLYRCYVVYSKNLWVVAIPFLAYLAAVAMGILFLYPDGEAISQIRIGLVYYSIALSLNVLLTLMIVVRLILHGRNIRAATGSPVGISGIYKTIATMLIESSALFAVTSLLFIGLMAADNPVMDLISPILAETQVIAPLLIIQRVASKSAFTSDTTATRRVSSFKFRSQGESTGGDIPTDGYHISSVDKYEKNPGELGVEVETKVNLHQSEV